MGFVHQGGGDPAQAVVDGLPWGIVGPQGGNNLDSLAGRRAGTHQLEEIPGVEFIEVQVGRVQVLVQVAGDQLVAQRGLVEELLPLPDVLCLVRRSCPGLFIYDRAFKNPLFQGLVFGIAQAGNGQGHALLGFLAGVVVEVSHCRALVFPGQPQLDISRHRAVGRQWVRLAQFDHPVEQ